MSAPKIDDGGPAFPLPESDYQQTTPGMSMRDYFAAHASDADLDNIASGEHSSGYLRKFIGESHGTDLSPEIWACARAKARYLHADAMIAARKADPSA